MIERHFHSLFIDGKDLADFGVHCSGDKTFSSPERDYDTVEVDGRNGDLIIDKGRYKNVDVEYECFILDNLERNLRALRGFLLSNIGYHRLEDTYHPDEYRIALFKGPIDPEVIFLTGGKFTLKFECKPQRYLKSGEQKITFETEGSGNTTWFTLYNPTFQNARPIFRIYNSRYGTDVEFIPVTLRVNNGKQISTYPGITTPWVDIDTDVKDCYYKRDGSSSVTNMNKYVSILYEDYPELVPGNNQIGMAGIMFEKLEITPRWWEV